MLPLDQRGHLGVLDHSISSSNFGEYCKRILDFNQMDFKVTYYQIVTLLTSPTKVYRNAQFRKQTKNRWARDDPAFAVIQVFFLLVAAAAYSLGFRVQTATGFLVIVFHFVIVNWLLSGLVMATIGRYLANKYLQVQITSTGPRDPFFVDQSVEWQYAFDIHCNSFLVMFMGLYVLQYILAPILIPDGIVSLFLANILYAVSFGLYFYITFLGYMVLPFLHKTELFLYPIVFIGLTLLGSLVLPFLGFGINIARVILRLYFG